MKPKTNPDILKGSPKPEDKIVYIDLNTNKALADSVTRETHDFIWNRSRRQTAEDMINHLVQLSKENGYSRTFDLLIDKLKQKYLQNHSPSSETIEHEALERVDGLSDINGGSNPSSDTNIQNPPLATSNSASADNQERDSSLEPISGESRPDVPPWEHVDGRKCAFCKKPIMSEDEFWSHNCIKPYKLKEGKK